MRTAQVQKKPPTRDTQLSHDLHVTGDDATDFMLHFFDEFSIDRGDYSFDRYLVTGGFDPIEIVHLPVSKKKRASHDRPPVTLDLLHQAALSGR